MFTDSATCISGLEPNAFECYFSPDASHINKICKELTYCTFYISAVGKDLGDVCDPDVGCDDGFAACMYGICQCSSPFFEVDGACGKISRLHFLIFKKERLLT